MNIEYGITAYRGVVIPCGTGLKAKKIAEDIARASNDERQVVQRFLSDWRPMGDYDVERIDAVARELWKSSAEAEEDWGDEPATDEQWESLTIEEEKQRWRERAAVVLQRIKEYV